MCDTLLGIPFGLRARVSKESQKGNSKSISNVIAVVALQRGIGCDYTRWLQSSVATTEELRPAGGAYSYVSISGLRGAGCIQCCKKKQKEKEIK